MTKRLIAAPPALPVLWTGRDSGDGAPDDYLVVTSDGTYLDIVVTPPAILFGSVVKGGPAYNVYPGVVLDR